MKTPRLKINRLQIGVESDWLTDTSEMVRIQMFGLPYAPAHGKSTLAFRVGNLWLGEQAAELFVPRRLIGMDEYRDWGNRYQQGHRGLLAVVLETENLDMIYERLCWNGLSEPIMLRKHIGKGSYSQQFLASSSQLPFFKALPFQLLFVQGKKDIDSALRKQIMQPNARQHGIEGIESVRIRAPFAQEEWKLLQCVFPQGTKERNTFTVPLDEEREWLRFERMRDPIKVGVDVWLRGRMQGLRGQGALRIHNVTFHVRGEALAPDTPGVGPTP